MMELVIYDNGNGPYGKKVDYHINYEDGTRYYTKGEIFYGYPWRQIVKMVKQKAREVTGKKHFHTVCYK